MSVADASGMKVSELEREVEQSRDQVSQTLDELQSQVSGTIDEWKHRLTAEEISKEVKTYVADSGRKLASNLTSSLETRFRENPASLVAMGAIAAWPMYRIARRIPLPVYLMGAGVALMKPMGRAWEHGRDAFADLVPPPRQDGFDEDVSLADRARGMLDTAAPGLQQRVNRGIEQMADTAHRVSDSVAGAAAAVGSSAERVSSAAQGVYASATDAASRVGLAAQGAYESATDLAARAGTTAQDAYGSAADFAAQLPQHTSRATARAGRASRQAAGNPWVIGMVGVAATAALAAALPRGTMRRGGRAAASAAATTVTGARAAIGRAYEVAVEEGLSAGMTLSDAEQAARSFVARMMPAQKRSGGRNRGGKKRRSEA